MNHRELGDCVIEQLKDVEGVIRIVLFGSVCNGTYTPNSDIDIAGIIDDSKKNHPAKDIEGMPTYLRKKVDTVIRLVPNPNGIPVNVSLFWDSEYKQGIRLYGNKGRSDLLHEVGDTVYEV